MAEAPMFCPQCDFEGAGEVCPQCGETLIPRGSIPDWLVAMRGQVVREEILPPPPPPDISEAPVPDWLKEPPPPAEEASAPGLPPEEEIMPGPPQEEEIPPAGESVPDWLSTLRSSAITADAQTATPSSSPSAWTPAPRRERKPLVSSQGSAAVQMRSTSRATRTLEAIALVLIVVIALTLFCLAAWFTLLNLQ